jgi:hypothetical protein
MTGNTKKPLNIFLMGESTGHISYVIKELDLHDIILVSSIPTFDRNKDFLVQLEQNGIKIHEKIEVDPFDKASIIEISNKIIKIFKKYEKNGFDITCALTGGTNLMAIAMGLTALVTGSACHYVVFNNGENRLVNITCFEDIRQQTGIGDLDTFLGGENLQ